MKFVLLLTIWIGTDNPDGGMAHVWVLDDKLSGTDCVTMLEEITPAYDMIGNALLSCEQDHGEF